MHARADERLPPVLRISTIELRSTGSTCFLVLIPSAMYQRCERGELGRPVTTVC
jgi:hypothetical protein